MKRSGHHFCDKCNDLAFGDVCRLCGQPARWVSDEIRTPVVEPVMETELPAHTVADCKVLATRETAHKFFAEMRALVAATPDAFSK